MNKFKVGDKVVVVEEFFSFDTVGDILVVEGFYHDGRPQCRKIYGSGEEWNYPERCIELEHIYNSPLYKALT